MARFDNQNSNNAKGTATKKPTSTSSASSSLTPSSSSSSTSSTSSSLSSPSPSPSSSVSSFINSQSAGETMVRIQIVQHFFSPIIFILFIFIVFIFSFLFVKYRIKLVAALVNPRQNSFLYSTTAHYVSAFMKVRRLRLICWSV